MTEFKVEMSRTDRQGQVYKADTPQEALLLAKGEHGGGWTLEAVEWEDAAGETHSLEITGSCESCSAFLWFDDDGKTNGTFAVGPDGGDGFDLCKPCFASAPKEETCT